MSTLERLMSHVEPEPNTGCWLTDLSVTEKGYPRIREGGSSRRYVRAHRLSWLLHRGPIPDGVLVCHRCDTPGCVNPDHLFLGTPLDNTRDMIEKGRAGRPWLWQTNKTRCPQGHPYNDTNTLLETTRCGGKGRRCRTCRRERSRAFRDRLADV